MESAVRGDDNKHLPDWWIGKHLSDVSDIINPVGDIYTTLQTCLVGNKQACVTYKYNVGRTKWATHHGTFEPHTDGVAKLTVHFIHGG